VYCQGCPKGITTFPEFFCEEYLNLTVLRHHYEHHVPSLVCWDTSKSCLSLKCGTCVSTWWNCPLSCSPRILHHSLFWPGVIWLCVNSALIKTDQLGGLQLWNVHVSDFLLITCWGDTFVTPKTGLGFP
jgi:hypothetical protein